MGDELAELIKEHEAGRTGPAWQRRALALLEEQSAEIERQKKNFVDLVRQTTDLLKGQEEEIGRLRLELKAKDALLAERKIDLKGLWRAIHGD